MALVVHLCLIVRVSPHFTHVCHNSPEHKNRSAFVTQATVALQRESTGRQCHIEDDMDQGVMDDEDLTKEEQEMFRDLAQATDKYEAAIIIQPEAINR